MTANDKTFAYGRIGVGTFDDTADWDDIVIRGTKVESKDHRLPARRPVSYLLKVGKRRFVRVRFE